MKLLDTLSRRFSRNSEREFPPSPDWRICRCRNCDTYFFADYEHSPCPTCDCLNDWEYTATTSECSACQLRFWLPVDFTVEAIACPRCAVRLQIVGSKSTALGKDTPVVRAPIDNIYEALTDQRLIKDAVIGILDFDQLAGVTSVSLINCEISTITATSPVNCRVSLTDCDIGQIACPNVEWREGFRIVRSRCAERANFGGSTFRRRSSFTQSIFQNTVNFRACFFDEAASFTGVKFNGWQNHFQHISVSQVISFEYATFKGWVAFNNSHFYSDVRLGSAEFAVDCKFGGCSVDGKLDCSKSSLRGFGFTGAHIGQLHVARQQVTTWQQLAFSHADESGEDLFNQLRQSFIQRAQLADADWAYRRLMKCRRDRIKETAGRGWRAFPVKIVLLLETVVVSVPTGYGTRPWRFGIGMLVLVFTFALAYLLMPAQVVHSSGATLGDFGIVQAVYFSVCTFTTLGYGDWSPAPGSAAQILATAEALAGFSLGALFVVMLARKLIL